MAASRRGRWEAARRVPRADRQANAPAQRARLSPVQQAPRVPSAASAQRTLRGHAACCANRQPGPAHPAPSVTRAAWRTAARGAGTSASPFASAVLAQHTTAVVHSRLLAAARPAAPQGGTPPQARTGQRAPPQPPSPDPAAALPSAIHYRELYAVARSPRAHRCRAEPQTGQPLAAPRPPPRGSKSVRSRGWLFGSSAPRADHVGCFNHLRPRSRRARPRNASATRESEERRSLRMLRCASQQGRERRSSNRPARSAEPRHRPPSPVVPFGSGVDS